MPAIDNNDFEEQLKSTTRLSEVIEKYAAEQKRLEVWKLKTEEENLAIYQVLQKILCNPPVKTIGFAEAVKVKETLLQLPPNCRKNYPGKTIQQAIALHGDRKPMSVSSVRKYLTRISALFNWAVWHGYASDNPFYRIAPKRKTANKKLAPKSHTNPYEAD